MKILIAVPTFENISPDTFRSIYALDCCDYECCFDFVRGYDCAAARNNIVKKGKELRADYILMVDNDVVLKEDALRNLLESPKDVCLGFYPRRNAANTYDGNMSVYHIGEFDYTKQYSYIELKDLISRGDYKIKVHGGGMGCAMIRCDVFDRIKYPWFKWVNYSNGQVLSEDLYFCEQCKKNGIPIYTDTRVGCGHVFRHVQWPT